MLVGRHSSLDRDPAAAGPLATADEIETLLIQALRQGGRTTLNQWATPAEARVSAELPAQEATGRGLKKKTRTRGCVFGVVGLLIKY